MNIQTQILLLDVDGVLVTPPVPFGAQFIKTHGELVQEFFNTVFVDATTGKADLKEILPHFLTKLGRQQTPEEFMAEWFKAEHCPNEALLAEVQQLKAQGWRIYLATNQEKHRTRYLLEEMQFNQLVDGEFASCSVGHRKPNAEYFAEVTRRLAVHPAQIRFWDDQMRNVEAAKDAGWQAYQFIDVADFKKVMGI